MTRNSGMIGLAAILLMSSPVFSQQREIAGPSPASAKINSSVFAENFFPAEPELPPAASPDLPHPGTSLDISGSWRFRTEAWDWFQPASGQNSYAFSHSLLRLSIGQKRENFEWLIEGAQDAILGLPSEAVLPSPQGQLGLGGTYFAANGDRENNAGGFLRQAYVIVAAFPRFKARLGRFTFSDGTELKPSDQTLNSLLNTRIAQRLIGEYGFSAVGRSLDGVHLSMRAGDGNLTLLAARPTRGVYQIDGMGEIDADLFYGSYALPLKLAGSDAQLRVFAVGYIDQRGSVLKTDNRPSSVRSTDTSQIRIGTYGANYAHVFHTSTRGQFDFLIWAAAQNGSWGAQSHRATAFVGEIGWQPPISTLNPWFSVGYSFGSGDSNPADSVHGTFFQILPTPRMYARFPFYNMENNEDYYFTSAFRLTHGLAVRSDLHTLHLSNANDLWYGGGGVFQTYTFGYTGRPSGGYSNLAKVWDISLDVPLRYGFSVNTYYGHAWGNNVVRSIYPNGPNAQFGYVETNLRF
jgi:alginate export protein